MAGLSNPRILFGVHSVTPYNPNNGIPYGLLRVLAGSTFTMTGEVIELSGGSNRFSWAVEDGKVDASLNIKPKEYPDFLFELFLGKAPTANNAEASGNVSTLTDLNGTTVVGATGLLGTITVSTAADLKFGRYTVKATGAAAFSLYHSSNIDHNRGTDADYTDDSLLVATVTGVGSGSTHAIAGFGITFTAGASAGAMTAGDTATFQVRPVNSGSMTVRIGGSADVFPTFGAIVMGQKRGNEEMYELDIFNLKGIGMALGATEKAFSESDITAKAFYNASKNGICDITTVKPS